MARLKVVHVELQEANEFVERHHRHHRRVLSHRFSIGALLEESDGSDGRLVGVAIVGRPVARRVCYRTVVEVTRLCTDGTRDACSFLYGAAARAAKALGYSAIQTYILESEPGISLKASGWERVHVTRGGSWDRPARPRKDNHPTEPKVLWRKQLNGR